MPPSAAGAAAADAHRDGSSAALLAVMRAAAEPRRPVHGLGGGELVESLAREGSARCGGSAAAAADSLGCGIAVQRVPLAELPADGAAGVGRHIARLLRSRHDAAISAVWAAHTHGSLRFPDLLAGMNDRELHALAAALRQACCDPAQHDADSMRARARARSAAALPELARLLAQLAFAPRDGAARAARAARRAHEALCAGCAPGADANDRAAGHLAALFVLRAVGEQGAAGAATLRALAHDRLAALAGGAAAAPAAPAAVARGLWVFLCAPAARRERRAAAALAARALAAAPADDGALAVARHCLLEARGGGLCGAAALAWAVAAAVRPPRYDPQRMEGVTQGGCYIGAQFCARAVGEMRAGNGREVRGGELGGPCAKLVNAAIAALRVLTPAGRGGARAERGGRARGRGDARGGRGRGVRAGPRARDAGTRGHASVRWHRIGVRTGQRVLAGAGSAH
jgi:hypothetical protein